MTPNTAAALTHAREAAQAGAIDAIIMLGPLLPAGQVDPDEIAAWKVVHAALQANGCSVSSASVKWMQGTMGTLLATNTSANARSLADQYWRDYGAQMMANLGCAY